MKFKNKYTGVVLETTSDFVEKMLIKSEEYEEVSEKKTTKKKID